MEHVRFTSEPAIEVPNERYLKQVLEMFNADRTLLFSSDYPHWDSDNPTLVFKNLSEDTRTRIFHSNAIETFGDRMS